MLLLQDNGLPNPDRTTITCNYITIMEPPTSKHPTVHHHHFSCENAYLSCTTTEMEPVVTSCTSVLFANGVSLKVVNDNILVMFGTDNRSVFDEGGNTFGVQDLDLGF
ncbi:hypothetical protein M8C21_006415, partial [Ambrosia artemisiifolia]